MKKAEQKDRMEVHVVPNDVLLSEVRQLLSEGHPVTIKVKGSSMLPFIVGNRDKVRLVVSRVYLPKDIVLAEIAPGRYVLHRIKEITGSGTSLGVTLMGDGNLVGCEHCSLSDIAGKVDCIFRNRKEVDPTSRRERIAVDIWLRLTPIRRWLLAIYRRIF